MKTAFRSLAAWMFLAGVVFAAADAPEKYTLRYNFKPGESIRWEVEHRSNVRSSISGTTQTAETTSLSLKVWRCTGVRPDGTATFEHSVEWVDMRQTLTGREEVRYNSRTDKKAPVGFEDAAKSVGVVLSVVTMAPTGKIIERKRMTPAGKADAQTDPNAPSEGWMTIPLPEEPVPIGHAWSYPLDIDIPLETGGVKRIKAIQQFKLEDVKTGVATIRVSTEILSLVNDPAIESKLVQRESAGRVRFDIDAGRVLSQQMDTDKRVVGFRGEASSLHYVNRFTEKLLRDPVQTAEKPTAAAH